MGNYPIGHGRAIFKVCGIRPRSVMPDIKKQSIQKRMGILIKAGCLQKVRIVI